MSIATIQEMATEMPRNAKTINTGVVYQDPQNEQKVILMINQAIFITGLRSHLLSPM